MNTENIGRALRKSASFPLKAVHRLYGYVMLAILGSLLIGGGLGAVIALIVLVAVSVVGGLAWLIVLLLSCLVGGGIRSLIRTIDPEYQQGQKDILETAKTAAAERSDDLRTMYKSKVTGGA